MLRDRPASLEVAEGRDPGAARVVGRDVSSQRCASVPWFAPTWEQADRPRIASSRVIMSQPSRVVNHQHSGPE